VRRWQAQRKEILGFADTNAGKISFDVRARAVRVACCSCFFQNLQNFKQWAQNNIRITEFLR
jgi:hypothetical protein